MKLGITGKLFLAIFATCMLVVLTMHWGVRLSFEHGFIDYIKRGNEQRIELLADTLEEQYKRNGNWTFIRNNERMLFHMMRSFDQHNSDEGLPPAGWRTQFWVLDKNKRKLVGPPSSIPREGPTREMFVEGERIGWIISSEPERLTRNADINFDKQQMRTSWILAGLATLLAAVVTLLLSRGMLAPVKRLVTATHRLAAGDFESRIPINSQDELGRLAQDFNQLAKTLEKNEQMRREFIADISHELRTPLAVLRGELEAMEDGVRQLTPASLISLQAEVTMLTKLVNDLHQLSLSDAGTLVYRKTETNLSELIHIAVDAFQERYRIKELKIESTLPDVLPLFGDPDRLSQLLHNLLENSLRYTDPGGVLQISSNIANNQIAIYWQDSSPGIDDEQIQHIFERFYRTEGSRNRASGGSGLGLAICLNIIEAHDGKITAKHSPTGGLLIEMVFPLSHPE